MSHMSHVDGISWSFRRCKLHGYFLSLRWSVGGSAGVQEAEPEALNGRSAASLPAPNREVWKKKLITARSYVNFDPSQDWKSSLNQGDI